MTKRSVVAVIVLTLITLGLYQVYWCIKTKDEMVELGASIPTGWLLLIPIANIYWLWRWSEGVDHVTRGEISAVMAFLLMLLFGSVGLWIIGVGFTGLSFVGPAILQSSFNRVEDTRGNLPQARIA